MTDNQFPSPGTDTRFPAPGTDTRFSTPGVDARFPSPGEDTRFGGSVTPPLDPPVNTVRPLLLVDASGGALLYTPGGWTGQAPISVAARLWVDGADVRAAAPSMVIDDLWRGKPAYVRETAIGAVPGPVIADSAILTVPASLTLAQQVEAILAGTKGFALDPSDFSTMWQNIAGTTPVTAVGQPVGRIATKWGTAPAVYQANNDGAARPVLSLDGLDFDGVDDLIRVATPSGIFQDVPGAGFTARLVPGVTAGGVFFYFSGGVASSFERVGARVQTANIRNDRGPVDGGTNTRVTHGGVVTPDVPMIYTTTADFITDRFLRTYLNGVAGSSTAVLEPAGDTSDTPSLVANIGRPSTSNNFYVGSVGRAVFFPFTPTAEQREIFEAWVGEAP